MQSHLGRVRKGKRAEMYVAMCVGQHDRLDRGAQGPIHMKAPGGQELGPKAQSVSAIVVAGNHHDRDPGRKYQSLQHVVQQAHCIGRWHRPVVDVASDDDGVDVAVFGERHELIEDVGLIVQ